MLLRKLCAASAAMLSLLLAQVAGAVTIDFEGFGHGDVVSGTTISGVTILAQNPFKSHDYGVIFDTTVTGSNDPDLEAGSPAWSGGNLAESFLGFDPDLGNILIVQRNRRDCETGICSIPDDQGGGGTILDFLFDVSISSFGFDLVDIDSSETGGMIILHDGAASVSFIFSDLLAAGLFGNDTANRFDPILASEIGLDSIDRVTIGFGGSGGIDNLVFAPVPEPNTFALLALGLLGIASRRSRHQR